MKKTRASSKSKKARRKLNSPKVIIGGERTERPNPGKEYDLRQRGRRFNKIYEFPQMKGRTIQSIRFYTSTDENSIAIRFSDRTHLSLHFEPALILTADLLKINRWDADTIKEWPPIHSEPRNPNREPAT